MSEQYKTREKKYIYKKKKRTVVTNNILYNK